MSEETKKYMPQQGDPHDSKIDKDDPRLRLDRPAGKTLKKGPIIGIGAAIVAIILFSLLFSLQRKGPVFKESEPDVVITEEYQVPSVIKNAPDMPAGEYSAPKPDGYPTLGNPLPGDLGATMVQSPQSGSYGAQQKSPDEIEYEKALMAGPFFQGGSSGQGVSSAGTNSYNPSGMLNAYADKIVEAQKASNPFAAPDQNQQDSKNDFHAGAIGDHKDAVSSLMQKPRSPYEVKAGTIIPASLITGINSDLPGDVIAQVRENVYDTVSGNHLLIPQGSRLLGRYNSRVSYGQSRAQVVWTRLLRPDGSSIKLESMPGVDLAGYSGYSDKVDNHFDRLIGGVLLSSGLAVGATASAGKYDSYDDRSLDQVFAGNVGDEISSAGDKITRKNLNIQPTIKVRPGFSINVLVNKDMIIPPYNS